MVAAVVAAEVYYCFTKGCTDLHTALGDFGLFDAAMFSVLSAMVTYYFTVDKK